MRDTVRDLNRLYRSRPALHARDCEPEGFSWLIVDDSRNSVFAWLRSAPGENPIAVISNFTPVPRKDYRVPLPAEGRWREILNTDAAAYGGTGKGNGGAVEARSEGGRISAPMLCRRWRRSCSNMLRSEFQGEAVKWWRNGPSRWR